MMVTVRMMLKGAVEGDDDDDGEEDVEQVDDLLSQ